MRSFLILLLVAAGGCVTRVETVEPPHFESPQPVIVPKPQTVVDKRVVIDPALKNVMRVVAISSKVGPEGYLKIQVNVQNLTDALKKFSYRIDWFDKDGLPMPMADSAAMPWMLLKGETAFLATTAPTPAARDFRITFIGPGR